MKRLKHKVIFCTIILTAMAMAGCGKSASNNQQASAKTDGTPDISQKIDLVVGGLDRGNSSENKWWPTTIVEQIEKKLNVNLTMVNYDQQKLGLDLASGELPDVMLVYPINADSVIKGRHAVPLNQYFDTIGKDLALDRYKFRNNLMSNYKSGGDGNVYFTTPSVTIPGDGDTNNSTGYAVRWDLYKKLGAPEINTPDDYIDLMKKMQQIYPKTPEGLPTYAMGMYNDIGLHAWTFHGIIDSDFMNLDSDLLFLYNRDDKQVYSNIVSDTPDTPFWKDMHFYNTMWKDGLLDPDCFITKGDDVDARYSKGQYFGGMNNWYYGDYNSNVRKDPNSIAEMVLIPCHNTGQSGYWPTGWQKMVFVSSHSKHIDRAVMFLDYINSEEFARLQFSGVEGVNWKRDDNGVPALTQSTIDMKNDATQSDAWSKLALSSWENWGGMGTNSILSDGYPASLWITPDMLSKGLSATEQDECKTWGVNYPLEYQKNLVKEGKRIDESTLDRRFQSLLPPPPQDITRIDGNVKEIVTNALPSLVQAQDDASFETARQKLLNDCKAANQDQALKWWQDSVQKALSEVASIDH